MAFFLYVAEEVREVLSGLGARSLEEIVGRVELLRPRGDPALREHLDLRALLAPPPDGPRRYSHEPNRVPAASPLNDQLVEDFRRLPHAALARQQFFYGITNRDRAFGARLAGELTGRGERGAVDVKLRGTAGQSFGAFAVAGMHLTLCGEANDYVGKGLSGGRLVIYSPLPQGEGLGVREGFVLAGNTCLYGATGGEVYIAGRAGERFAVRNSGADAVVEGVGDHGCEYMTGGTVVVLGAVGYNFGAGMTGGAAYVLDDGWALKRINRELVDVVALSPDDLADLRRRVEAHVALTRSAVGRALLANWESGSRHFVRVVPKSVPVSAPKPETAQVASP
jgi:glutamate synthase domain-containing protein 3